MGKIQVTAVDPLQEKLNQIDTCQLNHSYMEEKYVFVLIQAGDVNGIRELLKKAVVLPGARKGCFQKSGVYACVHSWSGCACCH